MAIRDPKIRQISYNTTLMTEQMEYMRKDLARGFDRLVEATGNLDPDHVDRDPGEWRIVREPAESDRRPLANTSESKAPREALQPRQIVIREVVKTVTDNDAVRDLAASTDLALKKLDIL